MNSQGLREAYKKRFNSVQDALRKCKTFKMSEKYCKKIEKPKKNSLPIQEELKEIEEDDNNKYNEENKEDGGNNHNIEKIEENKENEENNENVEKDEIKEKANEELENTIEKLNFENRNNLNNGKKNINSNGVQPSNVISQPSITSVPFQRFSFKPTLIENPKFQHIKSKYLVSKINSSSSLPFPSIIKSNTNSNTNTNTNTNTNINFDKENSKKPTKIIIPRHKLNSSNDVSNSYNKLNKNKNKDDNTEYDYEYPSCIICINELKKNDPTM